MEYDAYLSDLSLEVFITRGDNVTPVLLASLEQAIICIVTLVCARETLETRVFCQA